MTPKDPPNSPAFETVSVRVPAPLKSDLDKYARLRGETLTDVIREACESFITGARARTYFELPGLGDKFTAFIERLEKAKGMQSVAVVVQGTNGPDLVYDGILDSDNTNDSLVAVTKGRQRYILPRAKVIAWEGGDAAQVNRLCIALSQAGYRVVTGAVA